MQAIKKIAITGGIGSGKSAFAHVLAQRGYCVWDADIFSREVLFDPEVEARIKSIFGDGIFLTPGHLDRKSVSEQIFSHPELKKSFEQILHPAIYKLYLEKLSLAQNILGSAWIFYEASLILELNKKSHFDACIVVVADEKIKLKRLQNERKISENDARKIMSTQMPDADKKLQADFLVDNSFSMQELEKSVDNMIAFLRNKFV